MIDTWGSQNVIGYLRLIFRGHELPMNATPEDILYHARDCIMKDGNIAWMPVDVQFVGPGVSNDPIIRKDRITLIFGVIADGRRVVEDFSVG